MTTEEGFVCRTGCHWAVFLGPSVVLAVGAAMVGFRALDALPVVAFGLVWQVLSYVGYTRSVLGLTRDRLSIHAGFPLPRSYDLPLDRIDSILFYQPALGSLLDFGKVVVCHGRSRLAIRFVSAPAEFVAEVRARMPRADGLEHQQGAAPGA